ncbi:MAG: hypothetical protein CMH55_06655 [Myxococcales bacterium]|nr:hypothetical protein [Myxococcales bacterium]
MDSRPDAARPLSQDRLSIRANASWLGIAQLLAKVLNLGIYASLTRRLGQEGFGLFIYSFSLMEILGFAATLGLPIIYTRHVAAGDLGQAQAAVWAKHLGSLIVGLGVAGWLTIAPPDFPVVLHGLMFVAILMQGTSQLGASGLRGLEDARGEAWARTAARFVFAVVGGVGVWIVPQEQALHVAFLAFLLGEVLGLIVTARWMGGLGLSLMPAKPSKADLRAALIEAWPFAAAGILGTMVFRIDVVMLRELLPQGGDEMAGLYGAGYRLMESGHFVAASVAAALFPALVRRRAEDGSIPFDLLKKAAFWLFGLGVFGGLFLFVFAQPLLSLLAGAAFSPGAPYLQALAFTVPFTFLNFALGTAVFACRREVWGLIGALISLGLNVAGNAYGIIYHPEDAGLCAGAMSAVSEALLTVSHLVILALHRRAVMTT